MDGSSGWTLRSSRGVDYFELNAGPKLLVAFVSRKKGFSTGVYASLNLADEVGDSAGNVGANCQLVRSALDLPEIITVRQRHSDVIWEIPLSTAPGTEPEGDALYTDLSGIGLGVRVADCLPVFVFDRGRRCIGIAHCGWRGTALRLAEKLVRAMTGRFSLRPRELTFALGPCICSACYVVGREVQTCLGAAFPDLSHFCRPAGSDAAYTVDLRSANHELLAGMGLEPAPQLELCSLENPDLLYSARRETPAGRNLALIAIRS